MDSVSEEDKSFVGKGLTGKNITILGKGNIGSFVGDVCNALKMNVTFFKRGDDLFESVKNADYVVDALSSNPTTNKLLNKEFFLSLKQGSFFITVTGPEIYDVDVMIEALDKVTPGIATEHTLFYGVEAKFYSARPKVNENFESPIKGLYLGGDGAGITRGLAQAGANGVWIARHITSTL